VLRSPTGFGDSSRPHTAKILRLSEDCPSAPINRSRISPSASSYRLISPNSIPIKGDLSIAGVATNTILHQAGVIAYRILDGKVQVLLMTSRDTGRWIIPKGSIDAGATPAKAAEREAYEEAGVKGTITNLLPLGIYTYSKKLESGEARAATVEVYLLRVEERLKKWPEKGERKLSWVSTKEAVRLIEEPGVVSLLLRLMEFEDDLAIPARKRSFKPGAVDRA
jgi:8-oxo-dGTP pyrophosphatase MutT (NUDIX family)